MSKNLNDLNDVLFETLEGVKSGKIPVTNAQTIVNIGNTIISNARVQLHAFKLTQGKTNISLISPNKDNTVSIPEKGVNKRSKAALDFAKDKGYKNVAEAIVDMGKTEFDNAVTKYMEKDLKVA
ncbi:hypothetical protein [Flagellimonas sp.]|uniref:hypothetical protein n=1 Tax=Flagellimonas sp. TaxID=2058762 RepID=UPI003BAB7240